MTALPWDWTVTFLPGGRYVESEEEDSSPCA